MTVQFRNREDTRRYATAEDAFTSEGGYLPLEDELPGKHRNGDAGHRGQSRDFMESVNRYATGMRHVLTVIRGVSAQPATPSANPTAR